MFQFNVKPLLPTKVAAVATGAVLVAMPIVTAKVALADVPHVFVAVTVIFPDELPTRTEIVFVPEPDDNVQPEGIVHV